MRAAGALVVALLLTGCIIRPEFNMGFRVSGGGPGPAGALFAETAAGLADVLPAFCQRGDLDERRRLDHDETGFSVGNIVVIEPQVEFEAEVSCNE